jgi:phage regulator Rha-like protein|nr:MAG TPA: regulatory protein [Caudoviricetes sp.]
MEALKQTITTLEICEMLEMKHWQILRKLDGTKKVNGIIKILGDNKIVVSDYFIPSTYMTEQRREMPCYKGCYLTPARIYTGRRDQRHLSLSG